MDKIPTVAGVCSGVGGFDLAFKRCGARLIWTCEVDAPCRTVLKAHFPTVDHYKDMLSDDLLKAEAPDIFVGGTPCQGFSVAGLRKGLSDDRSNLALRFLILCDHFSPQLILWENVPGVLSDKGNAFGCFLAGLVGADAALVPKAECGGRWTNAGVVTGPKRTAAWRVLDSQYFGVAQRRNRVFVVASPREELPFQILFEPEGMRRYSPPSREAWQRTAPTLEGRAGRSGANNFATSGGLAENEVAGTLGGSSQSGGFRTTDLDQTGAFIAYGGGNGKSIDVATSCNAHGGTGRHDFESETLVAHALRGDGFDASEDGTGRGTPIIPILEVSKGTTSRGEGPNGCGIGQDGDPMFTLQAGAQHAVAFEYKKDGDCHGDLAPTLRATEHDKSHANGGGHIAIAFDTTQITSKENRCQPGPGKPCHPLAAGAHPPAIVFKPGQGGKARSLSVSEDLSPTLESADAGNNKPAIAFTERTREDGRAFECQEELAYALTNPGSGGRTHSRQISQGYAVRRLTPTECERLQAFPDGWTYIQNAKGHHMADGPRYKMMGNAVTVSVAEWLASRILKALK